MVSINQESLEGENNKEIQRQEDKIQRPEEINDPQHLIPSSQKNNFFTSALYFEGEEAGNIRNLDFEENNQKNVENEVFRTASEAIMIDSHIFERTLTEKFKKNSENDELSRENSNKVKEFNNENKINIETNSEILKNESFGFDFLKNYAEKGRHTLQKSIVTEKSTNFHFDFNENNSNVFASTIEVNDEFDNFPLSKMNFQMGMNSDPLHQNDNLLENNKLDFLQQKENCLFYSNFCREEIKKKDFKIDSIFLKEIMREIFSLQKFQVFIKLKSTGKVLKKLINIFFFIL